MNTVVVMFLKANWLISSRRDKAKWDQDKFSRHVR